MWLAAMDGDLSKVNSSIAVSVFVWCGVVVCFVGWLVVRVFCFVFVRSILADVLV